MKLTTTAFQDGAPIPSTYAFCKPDPAAKVALAENRNPQLAWTDPPEGTLSFAVICHDPDVPSKPDDVNQDGREVPETLARVDFFLRPDGSAPGQAGGTRAQSVSSAVLVGRAQAGLSPHRALPWR